MGPNSPWLAQGSWDVSPAAISHLPQCFVPPLRGLMLMGMGDTRLSPSSSAGGRWGGAAHPHVPRPGETASPRPEPRALVWRLLGAGMEFAGGWYMGGLLGSGMVWELLGMGMEVTGGCSRGLLGSSILTEQLWVHGFGSHWAGFGGRRGV